MATCTTLTTGDVPLTFIDGRQPNEVDFWNNEEPSWIHDDTSTGPSAQSASSPPEGPQPQASQQPQGSTIQPKKMPRSSTGGGASSSTHAAFRSGPGTTPQDQAEPERGENWTPTEDWMKRKKTFNCGSATPCCRRLLHSKNRELRSYDQVEISSFPPSRALTPLTSTGPT